MAEKPELFIAIRAVAVYKAMTGEEREAMEEKIIAALGCDGTEDDCPMVDLGSTVVDNVEDAYTWLG